MKRLGTEGEKKKVDRFAVHLSLKHNRNRSRSHPIPSQTQATSRATRYLVSVLSKLGLGLLADSRRLLGVEELTAGSLLALVVGAALDLSPLLESGNDVLVLPADLVAQTADGAVLATGAEAEDTEGLGNDDALLLVVGGRNTLEDLEALQSGSTTGSLVGHHTADGLVEDAGGSAEVEGTTAGGVETSHLAKVGVVLELRAEELAGDVKSLTSHDDDLLTVEQLLGDSAGKTTKKVSLAVNDDDWIDGGHPAVSKGKYPAIGRALL